MPIELIPLCTIDATLADPFVIGNGPAGMRMIYEVAAARVTGRITGSLKGRAAADWLVVNGTVGSLDVRVTLATDDGALIYAHYAGRTDLTDGPGARPIYVTPRFETGDPRYAWLNTIQAIGKGLIAGTGLRYDWYELR